MGLIAPTCVILKLKVEDRLRSYPIQKSKNDLKMETVIIAKEQFDELLSRVDKIQTILQEKQKTPQDIFLDNVDFMNLMHISKRTAQSWRNENRINFSQISGKIYYRMSDIQKLLDSNYNKKLHPKVAKLKSDKL